MARQIDVQYINYYCAGSSALQVAPAIPVETFALPRKKKAKHAVLRIDPVACIGIVMAAVMMVLMTVGFVRLSNVRAEAAEMSAYVDTLRQENNALQKEFESGFDRKNVEEVALTLGMVPEEQLRHVTIPAETQIEEPVVTPWQNFWASIVDLFA